MAGPPPHGGSIINIASEAGIDPYSGNAAYGTSKAAIRFFTRIAALEGAPHRVRVNSISPGAVATPMWRTSPQWPKDIEASDGLEAALQALIRQQGFVAPEQVAAMATFLASDEALHLTGTDSQGRCHLTVLRKNPSFPYRAMTGEGMPHVHPYFRAEDCAYIVR